jgi:hypothetical protein
VNQAYPQYVDSDGLGFAPAATALLFDINDTLMSVGSQGFGKTNPRGIENTEE